MNPGLHHQAGWDSSLRRECSYIKQVNKNMDIPENPDKTLFLQDFVRAEKALEKQLADPKTDLQRRASLSNKLTSLKLNWQQNGIGDINVVIAMRDSIVSTLKEFSGLTEAEKEAVFGDRRARLAKLNEIIEQAKTKGLV